jgi:hypothetical protein
MMTQTYVRGVTEHWTDTRRALVLAGDPVVVCAVADSLGLSRTALIRVSPREAGLALWGDALAAYLDRKSSILAGGMLAN